MIATAASAESVQKCVFNFEIKNGQFTPSSPTAVGVFRFYFITINSKFVCGRFVKISIVFHQRGKATAHGPMLIVEIAIVRSPCVCVMGIY